MSDKSKYVAQSSLDIRGCIKKMDEFETNFLAIVDDEGIVSGVLTEGDIRRAILDGLDLKDPVVTIANENFKYLEKGYSRSQVVRHFDDPLITHLPVLDHGRLTDVVSRSEIDELATPELSEILSGLSVVIMAGGKGTRLDPFTRVLPKPLMPIGNEPVIEVIMNKFLRAGIRRFLVSVNDKARMIKAYFHDYEYDGNIEYIEEEEPLGTVGALTLLKERPVESFFLSNCDIILTADYIDILSFHRKGSYALTLVGSMHHFTVPYGVCDIKNGGSLKTIREKPEYDLLVNIGFYVMEPYVLDFIPQGQPYDMTDLIKKLQEDEIEVGVYPVSDRSWMDVGQLGKYENTLKRIGEL